MNVRLFQMQGFMNDKDSAVVAGTVFIVHFLLLLSPGGLALKSRALPAWEAFYTRCCNALHCSTAYKTFSKAPKR